MNSAPARMPLLPLDKRASVSVVVVWYGEVEALSAWLSEVSVAIEGARVEFVAVGEWPVGAAVEPVSGLAVRLVTVETNAEIAERRRAGMAAATGHVVLFTEGADADFTNRLSALLSEVTG